MPLVDGKDVQPHLPVDKLNISNVPDDVTDVYLDVERVIKGRLSGVFTPLTLAGWTTPGNTPEYIRAIGGRLAAALIYGTRYAEDVPELTEYAQEKYRQGMEMLELVATGNIVLPEVTDVIDTGGHLSESYYNVSEDPKFSMDSTF